MCLLGLLREPLLERSITDNFLSAALAGDVALVKQIADAHPDFLRTHPIYATHEDIRAMARTLKRAGVSANVLRPFD